VYFRTNRVRHRRHSLARSGLSLLRLLRITLPVAATVACRDTPTQPAVPVSPADIEPASASNGWVIRANLPSTERGALTTAVVTNASGESVLYAIGGVALSGGSLGKVQAYNVASNTWTDRASLPYAAGNTNGAAVIDGRIYLSGGETRDKFFRRELYMYDPATNTWTRKHDMPTGTWGGVSGVISGKLYVLSCEIEEDCGVDYRPWTLFRYDPAADQWSTLASPPATVRAPMGGAIGGKLYITGTVPPPDGAAGTLNVYNPATNQWTPKTGLARARWAGAYATLGAKLYVIGGLQTDPDGFIRPTRTVSLYDPATNSWKDGVPLPTERFGSASKVFRNGQARIEFVGGARPGNNLQYTP
jgi:N-acetylneuraminic acid mutarotase